jgi:secreted Zn-dependent insulinase-like peptidase
MCSVLDLDNEPLLENKKNLILIRDGADDDDERNGAVLCSIPIYTNRHVDKKFYYSMKKKKNVKATAVADNNNDDDDNDDDVNANRNNGCGCGGVDDLKTSACSLLLSQVKINFSRFLIFQIISQRFFDQLRTKAQLGYIVHAGFHVIERKGMMRFLVQSEKSVMTVKKHIDDFISTMSDEILKCDDDDFEKYRNGVLTSLREKPKKLVDMFNNHW